MPRLALPLALLLVAPLAAAEPTVNPELLKAFAFRPLGPALTPGRIGDIAVHPTDKATWYVVASSGGVWKTTNAGVTFAPIFDSAGSFSVGCVTLDPKTPETVWVGTGENQAQRSVGFGDGVYKSEDGGKTWKNVGLKKSEHVAKILIHPKDSDTVYVAAQGPLWADGGDRGLYKTTDGGKTWSCVLEISDQTGVTDAVMDPRDPAVLYAASYQRRRNVGVLVGGGPESGIHKSTDGGKTWARLTSGLPDTDLGRIALAVSLQKPDVVYALFNTSKAASTGFYRSENGGKEWKFMSEFRALDWQYMGRLVPDPNEHDTVWIPDLGIAVTRNGGKTIERPRWAVHSDHHALWIDPQQPKHMLSGNDGGLYETFDGGSSFRHFQNLSTTQFYRVGLDDAKPFYRVYGGTQDNGTMGGPHRSRNRVGVLTTDWETVGGGDGFQPRAEPGNPDIVYTLIQNGALSRVDRKLGVSAGIRPRAGMDRVRWGWDTPLVVSRHDPKRVYVAGSRLYRSDDRGDAWKAISGDLTRQLDPLKVPVMGKLWGENVVGRNTYTTPLSIITALSESPKKDGLLYAGTDDGFIQITEDDGKTWRKVEEFPGVPTDSYCSDIHASPHDDKTVFATFNNWQRGDFKPYIVKSSDRGKTWRTIRGDFPARQPVWCVHQDAVNPDLLFAGTEFGLFASVEGGGVWHPMTAGLPTVAVRDFDVHAREHDLVLATFGRGFYCLDDITPLRHLSEKKLADSRVFPVRKTYVYAELPFARASGTFAAPNPPHGATATVYLKEKTTGAKLKVTDADGKAVGDLAVPSAAGLHRLTWNMRSQNKLVPAGKYTLTLTKPGEDKPTPLGDPQVVELVPLGE